MVVKGVAWTVPEQEWSNQLYQAVPPSHPVHITAIPYYAWDNRQPGLMKVWMPQAPRTPAAGGLETQAKVSMSFARGNIRPQGRQRRAGAEKQWRAARGALPLLAS